MSVGNFWLVYGFIFLFISGCGIAASMTVSLVQSSEEVIEHHNTTLTCTLEKALLSFWLSSRFPTYIPLAYYNGMCSTVHPFNENTTFHLSCYTVPVQSVVLSINNDWPTQQMYIEGDTVSLRCNTSLGRPQPTITWYMGYSYQNASGLTPDTSQYLYFDRSNEAFNYTISELTLNLSRLFNEQWIFCNSSNVQEVGPVSSNYKYLNVQYPPNIGDLLNTSLIEGHALYKTCPIERGNPPNTTVFWKNVYNTKMSTTEYFHIMNVTRGNATYYTCFVNNTMSYLNGTTIQGVRSKSFYLNVLYPPEQFSVACLADNLRNERITDVFNITEGTYLTLECSANSNPRPSNYSWSGRMTSSEEKIAFYVNNSHSGDYICTATNTMEESLGNTTVAFKSKKYCLDVLYPPQIPELDNITVIEGKPVEFKGNVTPGKPQEMQYYWTRHTDQQVWKTETFLISSVKRSQESVYTFSVSNLMKPTCGKEMMGYRNKTMFMKVLYPPEALQVTCLTDSSKDETIIDVFSITAGTNLTLVCSANSNPSPTSYSWSGRMVTDQSSISFYVTKQHSGDYICTVKNTMKEIPGNTTMGTKSKMYRLSVLYAPEVNHMPNMTAVEGERLAVYCRVNLGNPSETTFKWIRKSDNIIWYGQTMTIDNITRHDDDTYTCIANNTLQPTYGNTIIGLTSQNVNVEIVYKATVQSFVIEGHTNLNNVTINETDLVTFRCTVESNPASFMKLTFEDKPLVEKNITKDLVYVYKAKCTDWGTYFCYGHNTLNSLQNIPRVYINMYVNCAPRQSSTVYPANNVTNVTSGQHVSSTLIFKALAYPTPRGRWFRKQDSSWVELFSNLSKNILISSSEDRLEYNLTVKNITQSDYGQYRLDIRNSFGQHQHIFNLIPNDKPSPPRQFGVYEQNITETSVTLWWEPGFDGGLPQSFIIGIREETIWKNYTSVEDNDALIMNVTVTGLRGGTQYYFCIYASNQLGSTRFQDEITVTTKVELPFKTDSNVAVVGPAVGGSFGVLLFVGALVSTTVFCRKRRSGKRPDTPIYQNMKTEVINGENISSLDGGRSNIYEKLQNTGTGSDQQYQQLSSFAREGQHKIYENLRLTHANGQQGAKIENPSGSLNRASTNKQTQSIVCGLHEV